MNTAFAPLPEHTDWRPLYRAAISETDKSAIPRRIAEAEKAVLARRREIFYGDGTVDMLGRISSRPDGAAVFAYRVENPERYGVVEFDSSMKPTIS